jgi:predicted histone-like DNA-binding protein
MARNVTYSVSPRINPRDRETEPKFYGHVQASGDINLREMSERIQQTCTVHKSDVFAVLVALEDVITEALQRGEIVRLGDIGTLQIGISSKGAMTEEEWEESLIKKARINFRPGTVLSNILGNLTFVKVKPKSSKADKEAAAEGEDSGE